LALELAEKSLDLRKKTSSKLEIAYTNLLLGRINWVRGELEEALNYAIKCLDTMNELDFQRGISFSSNLVGVVYTDKGELNQAIEFLKQSLSVKESDIRTKVDSLVRLGVVYYLKGNIEKSINYHKQSKVLAVEHNLFDLIALNLNGLGNMYRVKGDYDQAIESLESSLNISERVGWDISTSLTSLILLHLAKDSREQAQQYLTRLEKYADQVQTKLVKLFCQVSKAMMLKTSGRTSKRAEAEELLRKIIEDSEDVKFQHQKVVISEMKMLSFINLFDLYFGDLYLSNNLEILEDINPLIEQMLNFAKEQHSYMYLAEIKLLQAKISLIKLESTEAESLFAEAQRIAEFYGMDLLAAKISNEHDIILTQLDVWKDFKEKNAPISERVKLASIDSVVDRLQRKRVVDPPKLVDEESTLLLIIGEGGVLFFSYPFTDEWKKDDELFSSFLSAFTSFSDEFFSEGLDRAKFGQYTVLMESVSSFSVCYLYRGQTYPAKQKLTKFREKLQETKPIWQLLEKSYKTGQVLELKDYLPLKSIITDIFVSKNPAAL
jgi:tetratricopeptide (TPR) repeat protein